MTKLDKELVKVKFKSFGKVTTRNEQASKTLRQLYCEKERLVVTKNMEKEKELFIVNEKILQETLACQRQNFEKQLKILKDLRVSKGKSAAIFNLRGSVVGTKTTSIDAIVMKDPVSQAELTKANSIKQAALSYCSKLLSNRDPKPEYEIDINYKQLVHAMRMREICKNDVKLTRKMFDDALEDIKCKKKDKYKFIVNGGKDMVDCIFQLFLKVWDSEEKPDQWRSTTIVQLYKGKGDISEFSSYRNIHTKMEVPKLFGHIVMSIAKPIIINNMTKFQIGARPGHRAQEHLFTLKSIIALFMSRGLPNLIQFYDISKIF